MGHILLQCMHKEIDEIPEPLVTEQEEMREFLGCLNNETQQGAQTVCWFSADPCPGI